MFFETRSLFSGDYYSSMMLHGSPALRTWYSSIGAPFGFEHLLLSENCDQKMLNELVVTVQAKMLRI
jgi:hypothetical protein